MAGPSGLALFLKNCSMVLGVGTCRSDGFQRLFLLLIVVQSGVEQVRVAEQTPAVVQSPGERRVLADRTSASAMCTLLSAAASSSLSLSLMALRRGFLWTVTSSSSSESERQSNNLGEKKSDLKRFPLLLVSK
ncbi:hypothetical protein EYF80_028364 [Liparis tanakae]|uniref:Uncharacterized protein n=1 Tax=Liparis tanakae TaxID=230148 RepID=A0A4Z2H637_9TELE|nr:hypothetical protein EYF80_028364 [Liparis tanakae]